MNAQPKATYRSAAGLVTLGRELGRGGEGAVFDVDGRPAQVAKIYHKPVSQQLARKLAVMPGLASPRILDTTAWPTETLGNLQGTVVGYLMPKAGGFKEIHNLYGPKSRRAEFPNADWKFLVRAAGNTARALATVHENGAVVGDFNQGGVVVSEKAIVKLIDCDSFQISAGGTVYPCDVGTLQFTPPELQGRAFGGLVRTADQDSFSLAVLVFHLLFLGRHPFSGRYLAPGDLPLEQAIKEYRFAYGTGRAALRMEPPPGVPALDTCTPSVARLFERAFGPPTSGNPRPTARDWASALDTLEKQVRQCDANPSHHYPNGTAACPWCRYETSTGVPLFGIQLPRVEIGGGRFDIGVAWAAIAAVTPPGPQPALLQQSAVHGLRPSAQATAAKSAGKTVTVCAVILTVVMIAAVPAAAFIWLIIGGLVAVGGLNSGDPKVRAEMRQKLDAARSDHSALRTRWEREAAESRFTTRLADLGSDRARWEDLANQRRKRVKALEDDRQKAQLRRFLEAFRVDSATIAGVGSGRKTTLTSFGVETAWDVTEMAVMGVPGFGPALTGKMMAWRREVERGFQFNPARGVDPKDIAAVDRELSDVRRVLENSLANGRNELIRIRAEILAVRTAMVPALDAATKRLAQAELDLRAAGG